MENCSPKCMASKLLIAGIILILTRLYTSWDIWVVIGSLLVIKGILLFVMPNCHCNIEKKKE